MEIAKADLFVSFVPQEYGGTGAGVLIYVLLLRNYRVPAEGLPSVAACLGIRDVSDNPFGNVSRKRNTFGFSQR